MENRNNKRKTMTGTVVSDKMMKTRVVEVTTTSRHAQYNKLMKASARYKAHDEKNESHTGDVVALMETRRLSKDKRWTISSIVKKAQGKDEVLA
ncbi:MAG: 30S ribosomal protein S17 [Candidatus Omnitrophica bacterium]|nr:30S ribosomal protein S17 [Candidatus Omnitrophota bacterium]